MPQGLQLWNASGHMTLNTSFNTARILNSFLVNPGNGSFVDGRLNTGRPFSTYQLNFANDIFEALLGYGTMSISINGSTISWSLGGSKSAYISYGVF